MKTDVIIQRDIIHKPQIGGLLAVGEVVNGYSVKSKLKADSGEAEIYLCLKDDKEYILKYYYTYKPKDKIIEKLKTLSHDDIVELYEWGDYKSHYYTILEYAKGGALDSKDENGKYKYLPVSEDTAIQIVREVINAFKQIHSAGIIHRDIKPGNLFYKNEDGSDILVGDFGIAGNFNIEKGLSKHLTQTKAGTVGYSAPEVFSGVIGPEMDYYSLGVTLWELLTGKEPFVNEKGHAMYPGQIVLSTIQGTMCETLLSRSFDLSLKMKTLIRGLMTVRHDKRWNYELVTKFLDGENISVFEDVRVLPDVEIDGVKCSSYKEIAEQLIKKPDAGKEFIYSGKLVRYLANVNRAFSIKIADKIDEYSASKKLDAGLFFIAYTLCPSLDYKISEDISVSSVTDIHKILETNPDLILPYITDEKLNFYTYLSVMGYEEIGNKIKDVVSSTNNFFLVTSRIKVALNNNEIKPFSDGLNNDLTLMTMEQLDNLSPSLKQRILMLIQAGHKEICAWIENITGRNVGIWRKSFADYNFRDRIYNWGEWNYFQLFLKKDYIPVYYVFKEKGNFGLKNILGDIVLEAIWEDVKTLCKENNFIVKKNGKWGVINSDGSELISFEYDDISIFDEKTDVYKVKKDEKCKLITAENSVLLETDISYDSHEDSPKCDKCIEKIAVHGNPFAAVIVNKNHIYFYNEDNKEITKLKDFKEVYPIIINNKVFFLGKETNRYSLYDCDCTEIKDRNNLNINKESFSSFEKGDFEIKKSVFADNNYYYVICNKNDKKYGLVDSMLNEVLGMRYEDILVINNFAIVSKDKNAGIFNMAAKEFVKPCVYGCYICFSDFVIMSETENNFEIFCIDNNNLSKTGNIKYNQDSKKYELTDSSGNFIFDFNYCCELHNSFSVNKAAVKRAEERNYFNVFNCNKFYGIEGKTLSVKDRHEIAENEGVIIFNNYSIDQINKIIDYLFGKKDFVNMNLFVDAIEKNCSNYEGSEKEKLLKTVIKGLKNLRSFNTEGLSNKFEDYKYKIIEYYVELLRFNKKLTDSEQEDLLKVGHYLIDTLKASDENYFIKIIGGTFLCKEYEEALYFIDKALEIYPKKALFYAKKGMCLYELGKYKESVTNFSMAIELEEVPDYYRKRGASYEALSKQGAPELMKKANDDYNHANKIF